MASKTGTELVKHLTDMVVANAAEVVPQLCERIESTSGEVPQKIAITLAYKPPKDDDSSARLECTASLNAKTAARVALARFSDADEQLELFA